MSADYFISLTTAPLWRHGATHGFRYLFTEIGELDDVVGGLIENKSADMKVNPSRIRTLVGMPVTPQPKDATLPGIRDNGFLQTVENHLADVRRGEGWRSEGVFHSLEVKHRENTQRLAEIDPKALQMYMGLLSGMKYSHQARLAAMVHSMNRTIGELNAPQLKV